MSVKDALCREHTSHHKYQVLILLTVMSLYNIDSYQMVLVKNMDI